MGTSRGRDPVPTGEARILALRSGGTCAYPSCGQVLVLEPPNPADSPKVVGKIAHICAASPGGPRYDPNMTPAKRGAVSNLIYLCGTHHDVIDGQLESHDVDWLRQIKGEHEAGVARAMRHAVGEIGFVEFGVICQSLALAAEDPAEVGLPLSVAEKINLNELGEESADKIRVGLAQGDHVQQFIDFQERPTPNYGVRLADRFKSGYYAARSAGGTSDDIFDHLMIQALTDAGPVDNPKIRAAALAVVAYLFERCEVFEHESTTSE